MNLKKIIEERPLAFLLMLAFLVRLIAVFFAKGYMMHDDHFLTVEPSSSWADGYNFNEWMPGIGNDRQEPEPISFFYLGFLFVFFKIFNVLGIEHPDTQMYLIRLIHAAYSLLTIYFAYRITERLSGKKDAFRVGLLLALLAILPNFSVRNLVELVCMPPLLFGVYYLLKNNAFQYIQLKFPFGNGSLTLQDRFDKSQQIRFGKLILAAFVMGLAVGFRYQTVLIVAGVGFVFLLQKQITRFITFGIVAFIAFFLTQIDDVLLWGGQPFQHLLGYFGYNAKNAMNYPGSPFAYLSFISLFIIPPVSLMLLWGYFKSWKKYFFIFLPITFFVVFHIIYPNRQERFILPALPFFVILGVIGWNQFVSTSRFWLSRTSLHKGLWGFFWVLNITAMLVLATTYSKRARVEAMLYLYESGDCRNFIQEFTQGDSGSQVPQFYSGNWQWYYVFRSSSDWAAEIAMMPELEQKQKGTYDPKDVPNYILFYNDEKLDERVQRMQGYFPTLTYCTRVEPGWFDILLNRLNPKNSLETVTIYKMK
jgi:hypothetical protein